MNQTGLKLDEDQAALLMLTVGVTTTTPPPANNNSETELVRPIIVSLSTVLLIGIVTNFLNMIVFGKRQMRKGSTFRFLLYLSISDLLVLAVCATDALARFGFRFEIRAYSTLACRLHTFLTYFLIHSNSTILMVISVDRALVVTGHSFLSILQMKRAKRQSSGGGGGGASSSLVLHHRASMSPANAIGTNSCLARLLGKFHRVDLAIICILTFLVLLNSHYGIFLNLNQLILNDSSSNGTITIGVCFPLNEHWWYTRFLINYWIYIDICVYTLVPFVVMSVCSVIILGKIRRKNQKYFNNLVSGRGNKMIRVNVEKRSKKSRQLLIMLLITNLYFFLSQLPFCITFVLYRGKSDETIVGQFIVHVLSYSNNSINFLFYGLSSEKYRKELLLLFCSDNKAAGATNKRRAANMLSHRQTPNEDEKGCQYTHLNKKLNANGSL
jgi:hypothetical protein